MSWLNKTLPPKIKRSDPNAVRKSNLPEGLWSKCPSCEAVLYATDLEKNFNVCPKCGHHNRLDARARIELLLDHDGRFEIGAEVHPVDMLKFKDSRAYSERLVDAAASTGESDSMVVMQGTLKALPVVVAAFEFDFMGGSMGSVLGERFVRDVQQQTDESLLIPYSQPISHQAGMQADFKLERPFKEFEYSMKAMSGISLGIFIAIFGLWYSIRWLRLQLRGAELLAERAQLILDNKLTKLAHDPAEEWHRRK